MLNTEFLYLHLSFCVWLLSGWLPFLIVNLNITSTKYLKVSNAPSPYRNTSKAYLGRQYDSQPLLPHTYSDYAYNSFSDVLYRKLMILDHGSKIVLCHHYNKQSMAYLWSEPTQICCPIWVCCEGLGLLSCKSKIIHKAKLEGHGERFRKKLPYGLGEPSRVLRCSMMRLWVQAKTIFYSLNAGCWCYTLLQSDPKAN